MNGEGPVLKALLKVVSRLLEKDPILLHILHFQDEAVQEDSQLTVFVIYVYFYRDEGIDFSLL